MSAPRGAGDRRRRRADPARDERAARLPRADVRGLAYYVGARAVRPRRPGRPRSSARSSRSVGIFSPTGSACGSERRPARRDARAVRRRSTLSRQQVVLRRGRSTRVVVRPFALVGRFARDVFERVVVNGRVVGGPTGAVRAGSAAVRAVQTGFLRYYAALLLVGLTGLGLYFLISARDDPPVHPALLAAGVRRRSARSCRARGADVRARRLARAARLRDPDAVRLRAGPDAACSTSPTTSGSRSSASTTGSASTGSTCGCRADDAAVRGRRRCG